MDAPERRKIQNTKGKTLVSIVFILAFAVSCKIKKEEVEIKALIDTIYASQSPYRNDKLNADVFSKKLYSLISEAKEIENKSIASIPIEEQGNIKPNLIEAEIFAGLYEGYTSYSIRKIVNHGESATVQIALVYDTFFATDKEVWVDDIIVLNEDGWKLDNVFYNNTGKKGSKDLQEVLSEYIKGYQE